MPSALKTRPVGNGCWAVTSGGVLLIEPRLNRVKTRSIATAAVVTLLGKRRLEILPTGGPGAVGRPSDGAATPHRDLETRSVSEGGPTACAGLKVGFTATVCRHNSPSSASRRPSLAYALRLRCGSEKCGLEDREPHRETSRRVNRTTCSVPPLTGQRCTSRMFQGWVATGPPSRAMRFCDAAAN